MDEHCWDNAVHIRWNVIKCTGAEVSRQWWWEIMPDWEKKYTVQTESISYHCFFVQRIFFSSVQRNNRIRFGPWLDLIRAMLGKSAAVKKQFGNDKEIIVAWFPVAPICVNILFATNLEIWNVINGTNTDLVQQNSHTHNRSHPSVHSYIQWLSDVLRTPYVWYTHTYIRACFHTCTDDRICHT